MYRITCIGHDFANDKPIAGRRKTLIGFVYKYMSILLLRVGLGMKVERKYIKYDYSEYLGADYLRT